MSVESHLEINFNFNNLRLTQTRWLSCDLLPAVVRPVLGQPGQPLVLTQAQLAQLQQSGILKVAGGNNSRPAAPAAAAAPIVASASNAIGLGGVAGKPIVIKTEPAAMVMQTASPLQANGRPTVLQAVPAATANANSDNDVSAVIIKASKELIGTRCVVYSSEEGALYTV